MPTECSRPAAMTLYEPYNLGNQYAHLPAWMLEM